MDEDATVASAAWSEIIGGDFYLFYSNNISAHDHVYIRVKKLTICNFVIN